MAELARAIAQERVKFTDGADVAVYTRLERLLRVLFTMALDGDLRAIRCLLEYMEGKPVQLVAASVVSEGGRSMTADEFERLLSDALAKVEVWRRNSGALPGEELPTGSAKPNG